MKLFKWFFCDGATFQVYIVLNKEQVKHPSNQKINRNLNLEILTDFVTTNKLRKKGSSEFDLN
jgi:hypothetical protein